MFESVKVIGFDADDTLWENEPFYRQSEDKFCDLMKAYMPASRVSQELLSTEIGNLKLYGYGVKAFTLSLIETALRISHGELDTKIIGEIINIGKNQLSRANPLLDGVKEVLGRLKPHYRLIVATKGDLLDQERKLENSGLSGYFHHIEIMSDKQERNYRDLLKHLDIRPEEFMMVGNSLKSDIAPVLALGGYGVYIPYHITWQHEVHSEDQLTSDRYYRTDKLIELPALLGLQ